MCGIAGIWGRDAPGAREPAWREDVARMLAALRHRGPDGDGIVASAAGVLGACRLAVIDPAGGAQPVTAAGGRTALALNGAVVNFVELRDALAADGVRFRTRCDTEVVAEGVARDGAAFLSRANGMFAVAAFDGADGSALLARDPCGIKPLYWLDEGDRVLFASEVKALLAVARVRPAPWRDALLDWLAFQVPLGDATLFEGVRRLAPGAVLHLRRGEPPRVAALPEWASPPEVPDDADAAAEALRALLVDAVRIHLRADVPLGAHLSGGFDSSFLAARASAELPHPLHVFTGAFDVPGFDERAHSRAVAAEIGAVAHECVVGPADLLDALPRAAAAMDEPAAGPGLLPQWFVAREASRHVKVVLGGQGGDELFSGYVRHLVLRLEAALRGALHGGDTRALRTLAPHLSALDGYEPLLRRHFGAGLFDDMPRRYFGLVHRGAGLESVLAGDLREAHVGHPAFERFLAAFERGSAADDVDRAVRFDRRVLLPALLHVEDRTSSAWSLESRVPLLDRRVLSFVDRCPDRVLFGDGELKFLFRRAVLRDLPRAVRDRRDKMGFPVPLAPWARGPLAAAVRELLSGGAAVARGWLDAAAVPKLLAGESVEARHLWSALNLELWLRKYAS
jgi:asparagine synthase (glutamine-hydrolysing)